ncbi:MAG: Fis family transcriptional regulator [Gammaproteobacteria bacterium]|jgi:predicted XRE-type DNA-binding protein|nr:MAG: Fis family transcriptional regulator [Gammaproteobacteria bacterium]
MIEKKGHVGESFEEYLKEQGTLAETTAIAVKRVLAWQLQQAMTEQQISKNQMAKAMKTSRSQLDRILDPDNDSIQLATLLNAARVLGRELRIELV